MPNLLGQSLGRYHILDQLGEGGMATVYKAYDTRLERDVAIKIIRSDAFPPNQLERILKRFEREAKSLARLSHTNIIKVIDYGEHEGSPYLVMEYLAGGTLKQRLGKPMPWQDAVRLILPIAEALEYAHEQKIIHRDIKPSNILLTQKGQPMLTDFGIAKILESEETFTLTGTGIGVGTPEYMAPEQWTGQATTQSDIYSLGVVLYEMVTGRKPYTADTPAAILLKQATEPLPRPIVFVHDLPDSIEKILLKALARNPKDRYQDVGALINGLENLLMETSKSRITTATPKKSGPEESDLDTQDTYLQGGANSTRLQTAANDETPRKTRTTQSIPPLVPSQQKKTVWWPWAIGAGGLVFCFVLAILFIKLAGTTITILPASTPTSISTTTLTMTPTLTPAPTRVFTKTPLPIVIEVSSGKPATASGFYKGGSQYSFAPSAIVDGQINEQPCTKGVENGNTYWLLPDRKTGWVQIDLQTIYKVTKIRWLNTHNGSCGDRATTSFHISVSKTGSFTGEELLVYNGRMEFSKTPQIQEYVLTEPVDAKYVRFYVDDFYDWGGGLNELEVYAISN